MTKKQYALLYGLSVLFFFCVSFLQKTPGYMDASYYYSTGNLIASGNGNQEPFIWNYLNDPKSLPVPSFGYWMPLAGLLSGLGIVVLHSTSIFAARLPFVLLAGVLPVLSVYFLSKFPIKNKQLAIWLSVACGLFSGLYLPFLTITETFVPFAVLGGLFLVVLLHIFEQTKSDTVKKSNFFILGLLAGLLHLCRADGILWLFGALLIPIYTQKKIQKENKQKKNIILLHYVLLIILGYLLVMGTWLGRNLFVFGSLFPPGSKYSMWMTSYNDLFAYPPSKITFSRWLDSGIVAIFAARLDAAWLNIKNLIGTIGNILLFPFMVIALYQLRKEKIVRFCLLMGLMIFCVMTIVFPFAGSRGGFIHSMSAFQTLLWGIVPVGFERFIMWVARIRKWKEERALKLFCGTLIVCLALLTIFDFSNKVYSQQENQKSWDEQYETFSKLDEYLFQTMPKETGIVMVNDSPSFFAATGRKAIQLADADIQQTTLMMGKFNVDYLLVDKNVPDQLTELFTNPRNYEGLTFIGEEKGYLIYALSK